MYLLSTVWASTAPHQQLRQADVQELQQEATSGNTHAAVVGEHPVQRHWEDRKSLSIRQSCTKMLWCQSSMMKTLLKTLAVIQTTIC